MKREVRDKLKKSLVARWAISYLGISLVPFILYVIFVVISSVLLFHSVENTNAVALDAATRLVDMAIGEAGSLAEDVILTQKITTVLDVGASSDSFSLFEAATEFRHLLNGYPYLKNGIVYSPERDLYISSASWGSVDDFVLRREMDLPFEEEEIKRLIKAEPTSLSLIDSSSLLRSGERAPSVILMRPLSFAGSVGGRRLYLIVKLELSRVLEGIINNWQDLIILNSSGALIFDSSGALSLGEEMKGFREQGTHEISNGKIVSYARSAEGNFFFGLVTSKAVFNRYLTYALVLGVVFFLLSLALTLCLVSLRIRKEWREYEEAIGKVGKIERGRVPESRYEPFVSKAEELRRQGETLRGVVEAQAESLREHTLFSLVALDDKTMSRKALEEAGVIFQSDDFIVVVAEAEDSAEEAAKLLEGRFLEMGFSPYLFTEGSMISFVVSLSLDGADGESGFYRFLASEMTRLMEEHPLFLRIASSDLSKGMESLGADYLDAINVIEWQESVDSREFMVHRDLVETVERRGFTYTTEDEISLRGAIENGDGVRGEAIIERIVESNRASGTSPRAMRYLLFSVMNTIIGVINRLSRQWDWSPPPLHFSPIVQSKDFNKSYAETLSLVLELTREVGELRGEDEAIGDRFYTTYKKALKLIQAHYADPMMNVEWISDRLSLSNATLSRLFKKHHGINISDYIAEVRILKAKIMLSEGAKTDEIADKCGFGSTRTFLRLFKKLENVTPSQYKAKIREDNYEA